MDFAPVSFTIVCERASLSVNSDASTSVAMHQCGVPSRACVASLFSFNVEKRRTCLRFVSVTM